MKLFNLLCGNDGVIINLNFGVHFDQIGKSVGRNAIFLDAMAPLENNVRALMPIWPIQEYLHLEKPILLGFVCM